jgi:hypothetical protein
MLPITLKVPVDIALKTSQLHDVADKLRGTFDPLVRLLGNLPNDWDGARLMIMNVLAGNGPAMFASNKYIEDPWPGFVTGNGTEPQPGTATDPNAVQSGNNQNGQPVDQNGQPIPEPTDPNTGLPLPTPTLSLPTLNPADGSSSSATALPPTEVPTQVPPTEVPTAIPTAGPSPTPVQDFGIITPTAQK